MSLFEGLNVATRGLAAAQLGISVTGQNLTNASTEGYSRKRIEQSAEWKKDGTFGQMGYGVEVYSINRVRDQFIDRLVTQEYTRYGYYAMKDTAYTRLEDIFGEPFEHALNSLLNKFWNNWDEVAQDPRSSGARESLRITTETMIGQFQYLTTQLRSYKETINDEIEDRVYKINQLTEGIYNCNMVIIGSENTIGNKANDTRDQRDKLVEELAKLVDIDYYEEENGALMVSSNGNILVSLARNHELLIQRMAKSDAGGHQYSRAEISFATTSNQFIPKQGELRALMDVRDVDIPKYEKYIDDLAKTLITEVNKIHQNGYGLNGLTFIDFFDSDPEKFSAATMSLSKAVKADINNIAAAPGGKKESVAWFSPKLQIPSPPPPSPSPYLTISPSSNIPALDPNDYPTYMLDLVKIDTQYRFIYKNSLEIRVAERDAGGDLKHLQEGKLLQEGKDYDIDYNTGQITFKYSAVDNAFGDPAGLEVIIRFDHHQEGFDGPEAGDNARAIYQLREKAVINSDIFGNGTQTMNQFYSGVLGRLGTERNDAAAGLDTRTAALIQLKKRQDEVMGVDMNEEIANLIQYQHTYQASARYLTTINTMLETLLNM
jgi:flagellar hook-associated protein 1 FlgK